MGVSFNGYKNEVLTFEGETLTQGYPVKMKSSEVVTNAAAGNDFIGVAMNIRGDYAAVQTDGYVEIKYTGTAPTVGFASLVADGNGGVKTGSTAIKAYKVLKVDTTASVVGFIL